MAFCTLWGASPYSRGILPIVVIHELLVDTECLRWNEISISVITNLQQPAEDLSRPRWRRPMRLRRQLIGVHPQGGCQLQYLSMVPADKDIAVVVFGVLEDVVGDLLIVIFLIPGIDLHSHRIGQRFHG
jgi:hypothetical protein